MCGIVGIINIHNKRKLPENIFFKMLNSMVHRGPDDSGIFSDENVYLGHRRLAILDLSKSGNQPMKSLNGDVWITYNGEVYNFLELKDDLLLKAYKFKSRTDSEVVLNLYLEYGIDFLEKLRGMFAFAIYDKRKNKVFVVRDRLGIKPLYYSIFDEKFIFSSEIKSILLYPHFPRVANNIGISSYLSYRYPIKNLTLFDMIYSLEPGHYIEININKRTYSIFKYWDIEVNIEGQNKGEEFYIENLKQLLEESVKYRMISDVPIGSYLSGGLDSSIIVSIMSNLSGFPVKTFTIGFEEEGYNEFKYARKVASLYGTEHNEILLRGKNYINEMLELIDYKDSPLSVANEPALYAMSKELKKYITVVLSGEGSDEIFGGYGRIFRSPFDYERMNLFLNNQELYKEHVISLMTNNLIAKYGKLRFQNEVHFFLSLYQYINWEDKEKFLSKDFLKTINFDNQLKEIFYETFDKIKYNNLYTKFMYTFEKIHIVGLLHRLDVTTMATSVEARVPFVDHKLVEFAFKIPYKYKLRWKSKLHKIAANIYNSEQVSEKYDIPKYILKKAYEKKLPSEVVWRKKMGFPVPVHKWFGDNFKEVTKEILLSKEARERGIYNVKFLELFLNKDFLKHDHKMGLKVWMLLNLELWYKKYIDELNTQWNS